ncbi:MFS transporter [Streptosporangium sp. NPDC000396]|uniref:MFS transporter n=1 Tax=Streptosporangium sp. NPDC000396 TaxID=3366185 RepID=UPI0036AF3195
MFGSWGLRTARAAVFAMVCVGLAAVAHTLGGGHVEIRALPLGLLPVFGLALPLAARERSFAPILAGLVIAQLGLHLLFSALCSAEVPAAPVPGPHDAHLSGGPGLGMLLMHAWAVWLTAWWLERGERALWSLLRVLAAWAVRVLRLLLLGPVPAHGPAGVRADGGQTWLLRPAMLRHAVTRRGPPLRIVTSGG